MAKRFDYSVVPEPYCGHREASACKSAVVCPACDVFVQSISFGWTGGMGALVCPGCGSWGYSREEFFSAAENVHPRPRVNEGWVGVTPMFTIFSGVAASAVTETLLAGIIAAGIVFCACVLGAVNQYVWGTVTPRERREWEEKYDTGPNLI